MGSSLRIAIEGIIVMECIDLTLDKNCSDAIINFIK